MAYLSFFLKNILLVFWDVLAFSLNQLITVVPYFSICYLRAVEVYGVDIGAQG